MTVHRPLSELDRSILAYLQKHGPSSTAEMRAAGLALEHGTMRRLHDDGFVTDPPYEFKTTKGRGAFGKREEGGGVRPPRPAQRARVEAGVMKENIEIREQDVLELLRSLPDGSVDLMTIGSTMESLLPYPVECRQRCLMRCTA